MPSSNQPLIDRKKLFTMSGKLSGYWSKIVTSYRKKLAREYVEKNRQNVSKHIGS